jgi:phage protein U
MIDLGSLTSRATKALSGSGNSLIGMAREFSGFSSSAIGGLARSAGFPAAGRALETGRVGDLVTAAGADAIALIAAEGSRRINLALDNAAGKFLEKIKALDHSDPPPAGDVLLILGGFAFMVGSIAHQSLKRANDYRWARQDRVGREPARQFVGPGDERFDLEGYLLPHYTGGAEALDELRKSAAAGEPLELIDHFGFVYGRYVIENIEEDGTELDIYGQPRRVDFHLSISAYGEDAIVVSGQGSDAIADTPSSSTSPETTV